MNVIHLLEDELDYELRIRKVVVGAAESISNKQRLLRAALRPISGAEQQIKITMEEDPETEFFTVTEKMKYITTILDANGSKAKDFATLETRMIHIFSRLERIHPLVDNNRKFDITVSMGAIKKLLRMFFPKSVFFSEEKKTQASKLDANTGAVNKEVTSPKKIAQFPETNYVQDPLNVDEESLGQHSLKAAVPSAIPIDNLAKLSGKEKEKYLQALRTVRHITAKVKDWNLLANIENEDNSMELPEQDRLKMSQQTESDHLENTDDEEGATNKRHSFETKSVHAMTENRVKAAHTSSGHQKEQRFPSNFSEFTSTKPRGMLKSREDPRRKSLLVRFGKGNLEHRRQESSSESAISSKSEDESSSTSSSEAELRGSRNRSRSRRTDNNDDSRQLPISRWGIKFSGDDNVTLVDFLRQIAMLANSEQMTENSLLKKAGHLFKGTALEWFMSSAHRFRKWKHLVKGLKEAFLPEDNDYFLLQECERRQQLKTETFEIYLAKMNRLFDGLSYEISEKTKLSILKQNLKPSHKIGVAMLDVRTVEDLRRYCRKLDGLDPSLYMKSTQGTNVRTFVSNRPQIFEVEVPLTSENQNKKQRHRKSKEKAEVFTTRGVAAIDQQPPLDRGDLRQNTQERQYFTQQRHQNRRYDFPSDNHSGQGYDQRRYSNNGHSGFRAQTQRSNQGNMTYSRPYNNDRSRGSRQNQRWYTSNGSTGQNNGPAIERTNHNTAQSVRNTNPFLENWAAEITGQTGNAMQRQQPRNAPPLPPREQQRQHTPARQQGTLQLCWNCDGANHNQRNCMAPRRIFCFICGRKDVYSNECPTCSGNETQRLDMGARQSL
jgi:hypothetical protein